jgi:hypothetical protein
MLRLAVAYVQSLQFSPPCPEGASVGADGPTALLNAKQGTSTLVPVGSVYIDDVKGKRSCASIFVGQESDTISIGLFSDTNGTCENIHARAPSAPLI